MFETIGDFDAGKDPFQEPQKGTVGRRDRTRAKALRSRAGDASLS